MDLTRLRGGLIQREHAHAAAESHPHMEELGVQLTAFNVIPQRLLLIVTDGVVRLRRHGGQRFRQRTRRTAPRGFRQIVRHGLQNREIKATALTVGNVGVSSIRRLGKTEMQGQKCRSGQPLPGNL